VDFHLLNNRTYVVNSTQDWNSIHKFLNLVFKKINFDIDISDVLHEKNGKDYDTYKITTEDRKTFFLKISFDSNSPVLARENFILQKTQGFATGIVKFFGKVKIDSPISCLLFQFPSSYNIKNLGREFFMENKELFFKAHQAFAEIKPSRIKYKSILNKTLDEWDIENNFNQEAKNSIKSHSDYDRICQLYLDLKKDILASFPEVETESTCFTSTSLDSIYFSNNLFYFDDLSKISLYHPFLDLIDIGINFGFKDSEEKELLRVFLSTYDIKEGQDLYSQIYYLQLKKKILELLYSYLREVYMFRSQRLDIIIDVVNQFHLCYNKFRKIGLFLDHREFLFNTITEPVFGTKA